MNKGDHSTPTCGVSQGGRMVGRVGAASRPIRRQAGSHRRPVANPWLPAATEGPWRTRGSRLAGDEASTASDESDVTLLGLAPRQPATVTLLGQARGIGGLDAEAAAAGRLFNGLGRLGGGRAGDLGRGHDLGRCCSRLGGLAQFGQRRRLVFRGSCRFRLDQRALARLARYVLGHGSADKGLTAAPTGGIEAIGGKVSNQKRTSPKRCH